VARNKIPIIYMEIFTVILGLVTIGVGIWWLVISILPVFGFIFMIVIGSLYILGGSTHYLRRKSKELHNQIDEK